MSHQKSLFDIYRNSRKDELHRIFYAEVQEAIAWIQRNFATHKEELSYHATAEAIGQDFGEVVITRDSVIKSLREEFGDSNPPPRLVELVMEAAQKEHPLPNPEQMIRYYERMRVLKSRKIKDVADFIVLQDISQATQDDIEELKSALKRIEDKGQAGKPISSDIVELARYFDVDEKIIKKHIKKARHGRSKNKRK